MPSSFRYEIRKHLIIFPAFLSAIWERNWDWTVLTMGELFLFIFCKLADQSFTNSHRRVMMFNQFRIPSTALLNRTGDVNEQGNYVSPFKDKKKRLGKHHRMNEWPFFFFSFVHWAFDLCCRCLAWQFIERAGSNCQHGHLQFNESCYHRRSLFSRSPPVWSWK